MAATVGVVFYHTWKARNWKIFKGVTVNTNAIVDQIKKETIERFSSINMSRKTSRVREFLRGITNV